MKKISTFFKIFMKTTVIGLLSDEFYGHHWKTAVGVALCHAATLLDYSTREGYTIIITIT